MVSSWKAQSVLLLVHITRLSVVFSGKTVATSVAVAPIPISSEFWLSVILVANCFCTVNWQVALRLLPSCVVTLIVAVPGFRAVTRPLLLTVATLVSLEDHAIVLFVVLLGDMEATSCSVVPSTSVACVLFNEMPVAS